MKNTKKLLYMIIIFVVVTASLFSVNSALADDTLPPSSTEEPVAPDEPTVADQSANLNESEQTGESINLSETIDQLPEGADLVILDENGEPLALVSNEAAEVLIVPDPYYTVGGVLYQFTSADCDPTAAVVPCSDPIQTSINYLSTTLNATPDDGNIYVEAGTYSESVVIDGTAWGGGANTPLSLALVGAGSGSTTLDGSLTVNNMNAFTLSGFMVNEYIDIHDNNGELNMNDVVAGADGNVTNGQAVIEIYDHTGDVLLTYVEANNGADSGISIDNNGTTTLSHVATESNDSSGIIAISNGNITLNYVVSQHNNVGADLCNACGNGSIFIQNSVFSYNDIGILADTDETLTANNVTADYNNFYGADFSASQGVTVDGTSFSNNGVFGLFVDSYGDIALNNVSVNNNDYDGAVLINSLQGSGTGNIFVNNSFFNSNGIGGEEGGNGLTILTDGNITISNIAANSNRDHGLWIDPASVVVSCSEFNNNGASGMEIDLGGGTGLFETVTSTGNGLVNNIFGGSYTFTDPGCNLVQPTGNPSGNQIQPAQSCSGETIIFPNEDRIEYPCSLVGKHSESQIESENLPGPLPEGFAFQSSLNFGLQMEGGGSFSPDAITLKFKLPEGADPADFVILFWNGSEWMQAPGIKLVDGFFSASVNEAGLYILAQK